MPNMLSLAVMFKHNLPLVCYHEDITLRRKDKLTSNLSHSQGQPSINKVSLNSIAKDAGSGNLTCNRLV